MKKVANEKGENKILISENGPYIVDRNFPLRKEIVRLIKEFIKERN